MFGTGKNLNFCPMYNFHIEEKNLKTFPKATVDCLQWRLKYFHKAKRKDSVSDEELKMQYLDRWEYNKLFQYSGRSQLYNCYNQVCTSVQLNCKHEYISHTKPRPENPLFKEHWVEVSFHTGTSMPLDEKFDMADISITCPKTKPCISENGVWLGLTWQTLRADKMYLQFKKLPVHVRLPTRLFNIILKYYRTVLIYFEFSVYNRFMLKHKPERSYSKTHLELEFYDEDAKYVYIIMHSNFSWLQAQYMCKNMTGTLFTVKDDEDLRLLRDLQSLYGRSQFIGLKVIVLI